MFDVAMLSRIQFGLTASFHYIYPPMSIGLGLCLVVMNGLYLVTKNPLYYRLTRFWVGVFGLIFGLGVATGIVMEFEFGTNWAAYSRFVGDIFGSALAAEGLFAFFLESGFLAVLLFGWSRVPAWFHFLSTVLVAMGATFSAVWIVVADAWMQTPAGYHVVNGALGPRAEITDFWAMVFNPSSVERLLHVLGGAWITGGCLVASVGAYYLLKNRHHDFAKVSLKIGIVVALLAGVFQGITGHVSALGVAKYQPAKLAAYEGLYHTQNHAPLAIVGWVDDAREKVVGLEIPGALSWLLYNDPAATVTGLDQFKPEDRPPVQPVFQAYRLMLGLGVGLMALYTLAVLMWWAGGRLFTSKPMLWLLTLSIIAPHLANQAGWFAAEVGRQPWLVYGLLRTPDGLSKNLNPTEVLISLILFTSVYALLFALFVFLVNRKIQHGPSNEQPAYVGFQHPDEVLSGHMLESDENRPDEQGGKA